MYYKKKGKGIDSHLDERSAQQEGTPEESKEEHQMKALDELEREAAKERQQREELEDEGRKKEQEEPEDEKKEREYEDEEVFSFSD